MLGAEPSTDAALFDLIHARFGVGDWSDDDERPWHKVRMTEISKINAIRNKRKLSISDLVLLVDYCHRHRRTICATFDLLQYWPDAVRERSANARSQLDLEIEQALELERQKPDGDEWVERFLLARGPGRQPLLDRWKAERQEQS